MKKKAYFLVVAAAALWGIIGIFSKQLSIYGFSTLQIVSIRAFFSAAILLALLLVKDRKLLRIEPRDSIYFIGTGIISFVFFNWCYFIAINKTSLSVAAILLYTAPAFVMVFSSVLFKEELTGRKITALLLTFAGCFMVSAFSGGAGRNISMPGILAGLGSGLGYALYSIFGRYALKKYAPLTVTFYTFVFAGISLIPISGIKGMVLLLSNMNSVYYAISLSVVSTVLPFILYTQGLSQLETGKASVLATLEPVVAAIVGIALFGESLTVLKIIGILVVIFAVSLLVDNDGKAVEKPQQLTE